MPRTFDQWVADQAAPTTIRMRCVSCGKEEDVPVADLASGDAGWYTSDHFSTGHGLCCGGPLCIP